jgi:hypothetical protein
MASEQHLYGIWHTNPDNPRLGSWVSVRGHIIADTYEKVRDLGLPGHVRALAPAITAEAFLRDSVSPTPSPLSTEEK